MKHSASFMVVRIDKNSDENGHKPSFGLGAERRKVERARHKIIKSQRLNHISGVKFTKCSPISPPKNKGFKPFQVKHHLTRTGPVTHRLMPQIHSLHISRDRSTGSTSRFTVKNFCSRCLPVEAQTLSGDSDWQKFLRTQSPWSSYIQLGTALEAEQAAEEQV